MSGNSVRVFDLLLDIYRPSQDRCRALARIIRGSPETADNSAQHDSDIGVADDLLANEEAN